jgi:DNA-binding response OmpR family regulator
MTIFLLVNSEHGSVLMKLLIIDDNSDITEVIRFYCESKDIGCDITNDSRVGLTKIHENNYNLILVDVAMPEFTGLDIVNSLKTDGLLKKKNVVIFTASSDQKLFEELRKSGVKEILKKPCSVDELSDLINRYDKAD